jgi:hypothetical protein
MGNGGFDDDQAGGETAATVPANPNTGGRKLKMLFAR